VRPWPEQVLPYGLEEILGITPSVWALRETWREVRLRSRPTAVSVVPRSEPLASSADTQAGNLRG